jgi:hypothetical protein
MGSELEKRAVKGASVWMTTALRVSRVGGRRMPVISA